MQKERTLKTLAIRFRRYCRGAYAAFCSMHREVTIGCVASYIADRQLHKSTAAVVMCLLLLQTTAIAQTDKTTEEYLLPTVDITISDTLVAKPEAVAVFTQKDIAQLSVNSIGDLLEQLPGIDLRSRGGNDVQGDLSMRGGTFDQMIVLLNGVNLTDAQTGHHNLDIPIDLAMVERVELIPSATLLKDGITAFCGAVNIVVSESYCDQILAQVSGGSFGQISISGAVTKVLGPWALTAAVSHDQSDGYIDNTDYKYTNIYLQAHRRDSLNEWHFQIGGQGKKFGSYAFYSNSYPDQFEATRTLTASVTNIHRWQKARIETTLYGRLHQDRFELFRTGMVTVPDWYGGHNYHLSNTEGLRSQFVRPLRWGRIYVGIDARHEGILSSVLGDPIDNPVLVPFEPDTHYYDHNSSRWNASAFAGYELVLNHFQCGVNLLGAYNTMFNLDYAWSVEASWVPSDIFRLRGAVSRTYRLPSFTDLYYKSANQISNPNLKPESSINAEISANYRYKVWQAAATIYYRMGSNIIDWVRIPAEEIWHSMNHTNVNALGGDITLSYVPNNVLERISASYSYCNINKKSGDYISKYALDWLRHKFQASIVINPFKNFRIKAMANYHFREGEYTDVANQLVHYKPVWLLNASVDYTWNQVTLFCEGYNLANVNYCDYGGIPQQGISIIGGARFQLDPK